MLNDYMPLSIKAVTNYKLHFSFIFSIHIYYFGNYALFVLTHFISIWRNRNSPSTIHFRVQKAELKFSYYCKITLCERQFIKSVLDITAHAFTQSLFSLPQKMSYMSFSLVKQRKQKLLHCCCMDKISRCTQQSTCNIISS